MMKRGKDEEKMMGPMFPRLHVNDTEKGGPRAPPRNKMALYEQLSIPSQRFNHSFLQNSISGNSAPPSSQGSGNEMRKFFTGQSPPRKSDVQYSQYTDFDTPLAQVEHKARSDEDDFRVPIFTNSFPSQEFSNMKMNIEKHMPSNVSCFNNMLNIPKAKDASMLESSMRQEGKNEMPAISLVTENSESLKRQINSSLCHEKVINPANSVDAVRKLLRAESHSTSNGCSTAVFQEDISATVKSNSATSLRNLPSDTQIIVHGLSNATESRENGSCGSMEPRNLERADSLSETSILDSISVQDITPDDVVGIIGQKHFWRARRAIANQQRVFAVQLFELHRLIKVQRLIAAASPTVFVEEAAYLHKPIKALPMKKLPLDYPDKQTHNKEGSAENNIEKTSFSSAQNATLPPGVRPLNGTSPPPSVNSDHHSKPWCSNNQPQGHHWLIPVMSPTEGLVYKPYPAPGLMGPSLRGCGPPGPNPTMGNFLPPPYGVPGSHSHYQFPAFGPPHGYFSPYGMPVMNPSAISGSSVEQINRIPASQTMPAIPSPKNRLFPNALEDIEAQASTASSPSEVPLGFSVERRNVLKLFPTSPVPHSPNVGPPQPLEVEWPARVIRVVPHNARTATESAARIFQSIQEERKQYDAV